MGDAATQPPTFPPPNPPGWLCSLPIRAGCWPKAVVDFDSNVAGGCARFFCLVFSFSYFLFFVFLPARVYFCAFFLFCSFFFLHLLQAGFWFMVAGCCPDCSHLGGHPGFVSSAQVSPAPVNEISLASLFAAWLHDCPGDWRARVWLISSLMELFHLWGCRNMPGNWAPLLQLE